MDIRYIRSRLQTNNSNPKSEIWGQNLNSGRNFDSVSWLLWTLDMLGVECQPIVQIPNPKYKVKF